MSKRKRAAKRKKKTRPSGPSNSPATSLGDSGVEQTLRIAAQAQRNAGAGGDLALAEQKYAEVIAARPRDARAWFGSGQIKLSQGARALGLTHLRKAVELEPRSYGYHAVLAEALLAGTLPAEGAEALSAAEQAVKLAPDKPLTLQIHARCLERFNRFEEALSSIEAANQLQPADPITQIIIARLYRRVGRLPDAKRGLLHLTQSHPKISWRWQKTIWHELGMTLDKLGEFDQAFVAWNRANNLMQNSPDARTIDSQNAYRALEILSDNLSTADLKSGLWDNLNLAEQTHPAPIFLVGFPRSGTTLTEQILAAHPQIETSDEYPFIAETMATAAEMLGGHPLLKRDNLTEDLAIELRKNYWDRVQNRIGLSPDLGNKRFLDKLPLNIVNLGFINLIFPDAQILLALRDPRAVCLSCFIQDFDLNDSMIHFLTLENTVNFYHAVMKYFLRLRPQLSLELITVRYEDTVTNLETETRRILQQLRLPWDDQVLRFHEQAQKRFISTPSFAAVTQPVHRAAIDKWQNYHTKLAPHLPKLDPFLQSFGYTHKKPPEP